MKNIFLTILCCFFSLLSFAQVQQDCGAIDCPGRCGRYIDQNADGFCDHGRISAPAVPETPTTEPAVENPTSQTASPTATPKTDKSPKEPSAKTIAPAAALDTNTIPTTTDSIASPDTENKAENSPSSNTKSPYSLILISAITIGLYFVTFLLARLEKLKKATHRKIWNVLLLITALVSCLLGFFLVIQINYNLKLDWLWTVKLYHVQFGIAMTIIAVIHILWHVNYWKSFFKKK